MNPDKTKLGTERRLWRTATTATGGAGLIATAVPFVVSLAARERARASGAPAELDVTGIKPGGLTTVAWRGQAVFVPRRSPAMLDSLPRHEDLLADPGSRRSEQPEYAANMDRSAKPEVAVLSVSVPTWAASPPSARRLAHLTSVLPGPAALTAPATAPSSTWPGGSSRTCRRLTGLPTLPAHLMPMQTVLLHD